MRRLVAALVVVTVAISLAGCGGGGEEEAATGQPAAATAGQPVAAAPQVVTEIPDRSAPESATVFEPFPEGSSVPTAVADKLEARQPMLILFVNGSMKVTNEVRSAVDGAIKENSGVVDLVLFDLGKYTGNDQYGQPVVDVNALQDDQNAAKGVLLAKALKVSGLPYIVMVDDQGFVVFRHRGLVDEEYLLMHMERLTD